MTIGWLNLLGRVMRMTNFPLAFCSQRVPFISQVVRHALSLAALIAVLTSLLEGYAALRLHCQDHGQL